MLYGWKVPIIKLYNFLVVLILAVGPFVAVVASARFEKQYKALTPEQQKILLDAAKIYNEMTPEQREKHKLKNRAYNTYREKELDEIKPSEDYELPPYYIPDTTVPDHAPYPYFPPYIE